MDGFEDNDGCPDAVTGLHDRDVAQPGEGQPGQARGDVGLHLDELAADAVQGDGEGTGQSHESRPVMKVA